MPRPHMMRYVCLEVSPAGWFSWLFMLYFTVGFFYSVFPVMLMRAGLPFMGMPAFAHSDSPLLHSALCFMDYCFCTSFEMAPIKCFFLLFVFLVNEEHLTLLNFPKEESTRQKLISFLFLVDLFHVDLFTSSKCAHEPD